MLPDQKAGRLALCDTKCVSGEKFESEKEAKVFLGARIRSGKDKAQIGGEEKDGNNRSNIPVEIKRSVR